MASGNQHNRSIRVKRGTVNPSDLPSIDPSVLAHAVRVELERMGIPELLEWKKQTDRNLQVIGTMFSDFQSTMTLAISDDGTAKDRLDDIVFNLSSALNNVGKLEGEAQQDEDTDGVATEEVRTVIQAYRNASYEDTDEVAEASAEAEAGDPLSGIPQSRRTRRRTR